MDPEVIQQKKKRKHVLSLGKKLEILDRLRTGEGPTSVAKEFKLNESTVRSVKKNEAKIRAGLAAGISKNMKICVHNHAIRKMEKCLAVWMEKRQSKGDTLSMTVIQKKAKILHDQIKFDSFASKQDLGKDTPFLASKGWFMNFKKRYTQLEIDVEEENPAKIINSNINIDYEAAAKFTMDLSTLIREKGYRPEHVFNAAESQIFWKRLPQKTLISKQESQRDGFKPSEDLISYLLCVNASCDFLVKPMLVYRVENPRALREKNKHHLPVFWKANRTSKITDVLFNDWFHNCFVHEVKSYMKDKNLEFKVLLILDDSACHSKGLQFAHPNVEVLFMPPNTAYQLQPLQHGIMHIFKAHYTKHIFEHIFNCVKQNYEPENVFRVWDKYSIADCIENIKLSLDDLKPQRIRACWKNLWRDVVHKSSFLPSVRNEAKKIIKQSHRIKVDGFEDMQIKEVEAFLKTHNITVNDSEYDKFLKTCPSDNDSREMEISSKFYQMMENLQKAFQIEERLCNVFLKGDPYMSRSLKLHKDLDLVLKPYRNMYSLLKNTTDMTTIYFPEASVVEDEIESDDSAPLVPPSQNFTTVDTKNFMDKNNLIKECKKEEIIYIKQEKQEVESESDSLQLPPSAFAFNWNEADCEGALYTGSQYTKASNNNT